MNTLLYQVAKICEDLTTSGYPDPAALAVLKTDLEYFLISLRKNPPSISETSADFYTLMLQLEEQVRKNETWKDFNISGVGTTLLELMAAIGSFIQNGVHVAFRETFIHTALRDSSIYAATRMLGVRIARKHPAKVKVWLQRKSATDYTTIPQYTQFSVGGFEYFNAEPIIFPAGEPLLPLSVQFDAVTQIVSTKNLLSELYLAEVVFANVGQLYYPCTGTFTGTYPGGSVTGTVDIRGDSSIPDAAFGTINVTSTAIVPNHTPFTLRLSQYTGAIVEATFTAKSSSAFLRFPAVIQFQLHRTGVGASVLTPTVGTANIPSTSVITTPEPYAVAKDLYLLPQYLDKSIVLYESDIFLYSGRLQTLEHVVTNSNDFYSIPLQQPGFNVCNEHVYVEVFDGTNTTIWNRAENPLFNYSETASVFVDSTLGNGDCVLTFGNGLHGKRLETGWIVGIRYALTKGSTSNTGVLGETVTYAGITGATLTAPYEGADEKPAAYYATIAPTLYKAKNRVVTIDDHQALFLSYPNVADVQVLGQKDVAPYDLRFMNKICVVALPKSPNISVYPLGSVMYGQVFDETITNPHDPLEPNRFEFTPMEITDFKRWFNAKAFTGLDIDYHYAPIPRPLRIKLRIFVYRNYALETTTNLVMTKLKQLFMRSMRILGRSLYYADLIHATKIPEVDYVEILEPSFDIILDDSMTGNRTFLCLSSRP